MKAVVRYASPCVLLIAGSAHALSGDHHAGTHDIWNERGRVIQWTRAQSDLKYNETTNGVEFLGEELGYTGHGVGDVNGDGRDDFAVTHYWRDYHIDEPSSWPYSQTSGTTGWTAPAGDVRVYGMDTNGDIVPIGGPMTYHDASVLGRFAHVIRGNADIDGDGEDDVIAGSGVSGGVSVWSYTDKYNPSGSTVGRQWIQILRIQDPHSRPPGSTSELATRRFGWATTNPIDMNGDGSPDLIIGAKGYNSTESWNRNESSKDEGAVFVYCMPPESESGSWWSQFYPGGDEDAFAATFFDSSGVYNGRPIVEINKDWSDDYYSIRITDPYLTRTCLTNNSTCYRPVIGGIQASPPIATRQPEFGNMVRVANDLDGDGYPDLVVGAPSHDNTIASVDPMGDNKVYGGKVYVYLSSSGVRSASSTPTTALFSDVKPLLHQVWQADHDNQPNITVGSTDQLDIGVLDSDIQILTPPPTPTKSYGLLARIEGISQIVPYNVDKTNGDPDCIQREDVFIMVDDVYPGNTQNTNYASFFEIDKRVEALVPGGSYPTTVTYWDADHSVSVANGGPDQVLAPPASTNNNGAILNGIGMAGQVDPGTGTCEFWMNLIPTHPGSSFESRTQICTEINGSFGTIWNIFNEPSNSESSLTPSCSTIDNASKVEGAGFIDEDMNAQAFPTLEPYEYWLPEGADGADQSGVTGSVSKGISRWWSAGDVDGDGSADLLGSAWFYPGTFLDSSDDTVCTPASCDTMNHPGCTLPELNGVQYFRAGKVYIFDSPFEHGCGVENPLDLDHDGVTDACDPLVSPLDVNGDGIFNASDMYDYFTYFMAGDMRADLNNDCVLDSLDTAFWTLQAGP